MESCESKLHIVTQSCLQLWHERLNSLVRISILCNYIYN